VRLLNREPWEIIVGFALLGLATAAASYGYAVFRDPAKPLILLDIASIILCPAQFIFAMCIDCEATGWDGFTTYSIIGAANMALYAVIGKIVSYSRKSD
jgi:phage tail sheath gpL-like